MSESLAYLAGLFDGEGCVRIADQGPGRGFGLRLQCGMIDPMPVERLRERFGGSVHIYVTPTGRQVFQWVVTSKGAASALREMLPWLIVKNERARLGLLFQALISDAPRTARYSQAKTVLFRRMKELNKNG